MMFLESGSKISTVVPGISAVKFFKHEMDDKKAKSENITTLQCDVLIINNARRVSKFEDSQQNVFHDSTLYKTACLFVTAKMRKMLFSASFSPRRARDG